MIFRIQRKTPDWTFDSAGRAQSNLSLLKAIGLTAGTKRMKPHENSRSEKPHTGHLSGAQTAARGACHCSTGACDRARITAHGAGSCHIHAVTPPSQLGHFIPGLPASGASRPKWVLCGSRKGQDRPTAQTVQADPGVSTPLKILRFDPLGAAIGRGSHAGGPGAVRGRSHGGGYS